MGKKAPRRNAYFMFMLDYKKREESRGRRFGFGLQEVSRLASEAWTNLPQEDKDLYKKRADEYNKSEERSQGYGGDWSKKKKKKQPQPSLNRALTVREEKQRREKKFIQDLVENMTINDLLDYVFCLIHVNVFCKTSDEIYVPAEIAISKFSLREGVTDVFHRILHPGQTPLGYSFEIKTHSEKTHRIPLDFVKATRGYLGIYKGITDFIRQRDDSGRNPLPIYTMFDEPFHNCSMSAVKYALKQIWETSNMDDDDEDDIDDEDKYERTFQVLSLPILFFHLKNKCISTFDDDTVAFENTSEANIELLNDKYEFDEELACQFHKEIDNVRYCSQSYTVRWAQVIREHCLKNLESEDEEEEEAVVDEEEKIKRENELAIKEEKVRNAREKDDPRLIKTERDIKKEKDDYKIKKEKDENNYAFKEEKDETRIKKEKDDRIKLEKDGSSGEYSRSIKSERGSEHRSRKDQDHRNNDDVRVKSERDDRHRSYDDVRVKREKDDRHRRSEDVRIKTERDERHRSSDNNRTRYKTEKYNPDYDSALKPERIDIPYESDNDDYESRDSRDSYRYHESSRDRNSHSSRYNYDSAEKSKSHHSRDSQSRNSYSAKDTPRSEYNATIKTERPDVPFEIKKERQDSADSRSHNSHSTKETHHPELNSSIKTERVDAQLDIKTEGPDCRDSRASDSYSAKKTVLPENPTIKTERLDVPVKIKTERSDSGDSRPDYDSILKTEHMDIPFHIKSERCDDDEHTHRNSSSVSELHRSAPVQMIYSTSCSSSRSHGFPIPIPIKIEKDTHSDLLKPIKKEKDSRSDFPMPIPIKIEKDSHVDEQPSSQTQPNINSNKHDLPMLTSIKMEKSETPQSNSKQDFPMPMIIKTEKSTEPREYVESSSVCNDFPMLSTIKTEKSSEPNQPAENAPRKNGLPLPITVKVEKDVSIKKEPSSSLNTSLTSRKRTIDSIDLVEDGEDVKPIPAKIKMSVERDTESIVDVPPGNVRIKNEPPPDTYSIHEIKHEEVDVDDEDVVR